VHTNISGIYTIYNYSQKLLLYGGSGGWVVALFKEEAGRLIYN
jgi:hypothetical protein